MPDSVPAANSDRPALGHRRREYRRDRYALVCGLILATILSTAVLGDGVAGLLLTMALMTLTLLVTLVTSNAGSRTLLAGTGIAVAALVAVGIAVLTQNTGPAKLVYGAAMLVLVGVTPVVIANRLRTHKVVNLSTVTGAAAIYLLIGLLFAVLYSFLGALIGVPAGIPSGTAFFTALRPIEASDFAYYSFTTLTTVGYGDLTATIALGRMLSVCEALLGQLYLVTIVAVLVANIGRGRQHAADDPEDSPRAEG